MSELENWKHMLKKVIEDTETNKNKTADDVIKALIHELAGIKGDSLSELEIPHYSR